MVAIIMKIRDNYFLIISNSLTDKTETKIKSSLYMFFYFSVLL